MQALRSCSSQQGIPARKLALHSERREQACAVMRFAGAHGHVLQAGCAELYPGCYLEFCREHVMCKLVLEVAGWCCDSVQTRVVIISLVKCWG